MLISGLLSCRVPSPLPPTASHDFRFYSSTYSFLLPSLSLLFIPDSLIHTSLFTYESLRFISILFDFLLHCCLIDVTHIPLHDHRYLNCIKWILSCDIIRIRQFSIVSCHIEGLVFIVRLRCRCELRRMF